MKSALNDRLILAAGGSGGLGSATVWLLAREGARLAVSYLSNQERADELSPIADVYQADITLEPDRARLLDALPGLYGLVVFTGTPARGPSAAEESWRVNYLGPVELARAAAARMQSRNVPGSIVLISTMQATSLFAGSTNYAAPKAALLHAMKILAKECRGSGIRVNAVCPGVIQAGMALESIGKGKYAPYLESRAITRYGLPDDVARAVRLFLEPDNYITGQALTVDGGLSL